MREERGYLSVDILEKACREQNDFFHSNSQQQLVHAAAAHVRDRNPVHFRRIFLSSLEQLATGVLLSEVGNNFNLHFLFLESKYVENHVMGLIEQVEGCSYVEDKTLTVVNALAQFFADQTPIAFNYETEYDYHLPKSVLANQQDILAFFKAIQSLHYGRPEKYLAVLQSIAQNSSSSLARSAE